MASRTKVVTPTNKGLVYCPMCTHTVEAEVVQNQRHLFVRPGQKCARCSSSLDAGVIVRLDRAA